MRCGLLQHPRCAIVSAASKPASQRNSIWEQLLKKLAEQAMALPSEARARLADLLVESLEGADLGRIEDLWIPEAKRRRDEVRTGEVKAVPGEKALQDVRNSLRR